MVVETVGSKHDLARHLANTPANMSRSRLIHAVALQSREKRRTVQMADRCATFILAV